MANQPGQREWQQAELGLCASSSPLLLDRGDSTFQLQWKEKGLILRGILFPEDI